MNTPEEVLSFGRVIQEGDAEFVSKYWAEKAIESARLEVAEYFIGMAGVFGHYEFFTKELWRKVKGFKKADKAEIIAAFLHYSFHNKFGFYTCPCGMEWFANLDKECYEGYIKKYEPLLKAYIDWLIKQR